MQFFKGQHIQKRFQHGTESESEAYEKIQRPWKSEAKSGAGLFI